MKTLEDRFWAKVQKHGQRQCWPWLGAKNGKGYGVISAGRRDQGLLNATHVSLGIVGVAVPTGRCVLHTCDTPSCVNPRHLKVGTGKQNSADMVAKGRSLKGERQPNAKLSATAVKAIRAARGLHREIAIRFGVTRETVGQIRRRVSWTHI